MKNLKYYIALTLIEDIGRLTAMRLIRHFGNAEAVFSATYSDLIRIEGIGAKRAEAVSGFSDWKGVEEIIRDVGKCGARCLTVEDEEYPPLLKRIDDPPVVFYIKGSLTSRDSHSVAIVGTRNPTHYGIATTERLSAELATLDITIVSGMARGVDTVAHTSALDADGRTIAVLGCGIDIVYPSENRRLAERIISNGAIVSEYPPAYPPHPSYFPARNRIISGMSSGVIITEAPVQSGALITARHALEQNREVFAVPGNILSQKADGNNMLIKQGAKLIVDISDVLEELGSDFKGVYREVKKEKMVLDKDETRICNLLSCEPLHIDSLIRQTGMPSSLALSILLRLEMKGAVRQLAGKHFLLNIEL